MDDFKKECMRYVSIGGFHCPCCNDFRSFSNKRKLKKVKKVKRGLNKRVRYNLKLELKKELENGECE